MNEKLYSFQHHTQAPATSSNDLSNTLPLIMYMSSDSLLNFQTCISCLSCDISSPDPSVSRINIGTLEIMECLPNDVYSFLFLLKHIWIVTF